MARLSSASTESEYVPAMVPFHWEVAPGRPAVQQIIDPPSLPLPPGKRPKDGFYLPFPRPPPLEPSTSRERRRFDLRSSKMPFSRKSRDVGSGFGHVSGHRFVSRVARRVIVELQKGRSCLADWKRKSSSSHSHHHPCGGLDSIRELPSPSGSSDFSSHERPYDSSVARQHSQPQLQVLRTSRFMASMLMALCPADEESDHDVDGEEAAVDDGESSSSEVEVAVPRARVSSPEALFQAPREGPPMKAQDMASPSHEERTRAWVDLSTEMSRCSLSKRTLHKDPTHCECCGTKLQQPRMLSWRPRTQIRTERDPDSDAFSARSHVPKSYRDLRTRPSFASTLWQEALRSSPSWPNPTPKTSTDDDSDEDSSTCSRVSSLAPVVTPPRALLKHKQELQQDQSPRSSFSQEGTRRVPSPVSKRNACGVMSMVAQLEAKAGEGCSSGESLPVNVTRRISRHHRQRQSNRVMIPGSAR